MIVLGIHDGKDAGVALLQDGELIYAANEERFSRNKLHFGFPYLSLRNLFSHTRIDPKTIEKETIRVDQQIF